MQPEKKHPSIPRQLERFYNFHGIQLLGSKFPMGLMELLHHKISNKIYDAGEYFKIFDNPDAATYEVHAIKSFKADQQVFLIDHAISFRYPQLRQLLLANPNIVDRLENLTKYLGTNNELKGTNTSQKQDPRNVEYDSMELANIQNLSVQNQTICLSFVDNNLTDVKEILDLLGRLKDLRALWLSDNPIQNDLQLREYIQSHTNIELYNRLLTPKATAWILKFITFKDIQKASTIPNNQVHFLNLDGRGIFTIDFSVFKEFSNLRHLSMLETPVTELEQVNKLIEILKLPALRRLDVDLEVESTIFRLFTSKSFECSKKLLVNGHNVFMPEASENDLRLDRIHERVFKLAGCYRLASTEKLDETSVWYVNDELGSSITHSDNPQVVLVPFLYSRSCHIGEEMEAFTIMWAVKDIEEGQLIERDFLCGLPESKQRSSRLAAWYNLPRQTFYQHYEKFQQKMNQLSESTASKIASLKIAPEKQLQLSSILKEKSVLKVLTDSSLLTQNLTQPHFAFTKNLDQTDIIWVDEAIGDQYQQLKKPSAILNQFPFEACLVMKNNLANTVQQTLGNTKFLQRTYDLETQLPIFLGHFYRNEEQQLDNLWISKPPNMARSMDMIVSDNLSIIIRNMETGPKLVQKYISNPVKRLNRKIDLRFIVVLRSVMPLQAYLYKHFWIRTSNNQYNLDCRFREEYETHFTVMNYGKKLTQIMYPEFMEQFSKDYAPMTWSIVHEKIRQLLRMTLLAAQIRHPEMHNPNSRAMYGVDIMVDEDDFEPKLLQFTFSPDCVRACKFYPSFFNEVFEALFLDKLSDNMEKLF